MALPLTDAVARRPVRTMVRLDRVVIVFVPVIAAHWRLGAAETKYLRWA